MKGIKLKGKPNLKGIFTKRIISISLILIVIAGATFGTIKFVQSRSSKKSTVTQRTARVTRGDITVSITGSGPVESAQSVDLTSAVSSTITNVFFKDGDTVKKGDVIIELENQDAKDKLDSINSQIDDIQSSISDVEDSIKNLKITAPISGFVKDLNASVGDKVAKSSKVLTIVDTSELKVTLPFSAQNFGKLKLGDPAYVNVSDISQTLLGKITYIGNTTYINEYGGRVFDIEITVQNPGALQEGMKASGQIQTSNGSELSTSEGTLEYVSKQDVKTQVDGDVIGVYTRNNQYVQKGTLLIELKNDDLSKQKKNYEQQLNSLLTQKKDAENNLENYYIKAPFDGVVTNINYKKGDTIKSGEVLATVFDNKNLVFNVDIDELDIAKIKVGQKVNITLDALSETQTNPLTGKVSKIPLEGTTQNGVTTYSVTISIDNPKNIKIGMNANAEIIVNQKQDTLLVPLEAVQKFGNRYFVFVKTNGSQSSSQQESPFGGFSQGQNNQTGQWRQSQSQSSSGESSSSSENSASNWRSRVYTGDSQNVNSGQSAQSGQSSNNQTTNNQSNSQFASSRRFSRMLNNEYYKGTTLRPIEVGINNDQYIEVISGLSEGDVVVLPQLTTGTQTTQTTQQQGFNIMGGFGGPQGEFRQFRQQSGSSTRRSSSSSGSSSSGGTQGSSNINR